MAANAGTQFSKPPIVDGDAPRLSGLAAAARALRAGEECAVHDMLRRR